MPTVQHNTLTTTDLHEPKGISTANASEVYVCAGGGTGAWELLNPYGGWRYNNIGTGTTYSTPTTYTLVNVAGTTTMVQNFTHNSLGRLTYTGTDARHCHAVIDISFKHSTAGGADVYFAIYKKGSILGTPNAEVVVSADSSDYMRMALHFDDMMVQNDYYEVYTKCATGNVIIHAAYMFIMGMPG
jgi:hypothetical protein